MLTQVKATVDAALANAKVVGDQPVGKISADITTSFKGGSYVDGKYAGGERDVREQESTLGDLVANALRDGIPADQGKPDLGIVNPGGLRDELLLRGPPRHQPGQHRRRGHLRRGQRGAAVRQQRLAGPADRRPAQAGARAAVAARRRDRAFLALGPLRQRPGHPGRLEARREADHLGDRQRELARPARRPTRSARSRSSARVATTSPRSRSGKPKDTGLVDRDVWIGYLKKAGTIAPDFARQQVTAKNMKHSVKPNKKYTFRVGNLDLTSLGSPQNTEAGRLRDRPGQGQADPGEAGRVPGEGRSGEVQLPHAADPLLAAVGRRRAHGHHGRRLPRHSSTTRSRPSRGWRPRSRPSPRSSARPRPPSASRSRCPACSPRAGPRSRSARSSTRASWSTARSW